jgi:orotidine-5'-phosphate decarboxylase
VKTRGAGRSRMSPMTVMFPHREVPEKVEDRLIVALDVPSISSARTLIDKLDGLVSFFKVGLWLQFAAGFDGLIDELLKRDKKIFLDAKMFDIGETVKQGVSRAAERGVSFVTVHGDGEIMKAAVEGRGDSRLKIFAISVLTSIDEDGLRDLGYLCSVEDLIRIRVKKSIECGCDGVIAAPHDNPNQIRALAGQQGLLIATPGVRLAGAAADDHKRPGTPAQAIAAGADYLVVGRPIVRSDDPAHAAAVIIENMRSGA